MKNLSFKLFASIALLFVLVNHNTSYGQEMWYRDNTTNIIHNAWTNDPVVQIRDNYLNNSEHAARLELVEHNSLKFDLGGYLDYNGHANFFTIGTINYGTDIPAITIHRSSGRVGIGTTNPPSGFALAVNGKIKSKGVLCSVDGWADFVFEKDYTLRPLSEVEAYIADNGHLPEIPSTQEVMKSGIELPVMDAKLLQKVEELTLYLIEQQKEIAELRKELDALKK